MTKLKIATFLLLIGTASAGATTIGFDLGVEYSGGASPASTTLPWLRATFSDASGGVDLTMQALNLTGTEFISTWRFNLNPLLNPSLLSFTQLGGQTAQSIVAGTNCCNTAGGGIFDFKFNFATASGPDRFTDDETSTYRISGIVGLTAGDFQYLSSPSGGNGTWYTAAHVQSIAAPPGSGWIGGDQSVPEPSSLLLVLSAAGLGVCWRRKLVRF